MPQAKYDQISISEIARAMGIDRRTVVKRLQSLGNDATLEEIIGALCTSEGIEEARRRKTLAEAESKELKLKQEKGELLKKDEVLQTLVTLLKWLRNEQAVLMPPRIAPQLVGKNEREISAILTREQDRIFNAARTRASIFDSHADSLSAAESQCVGLGSQEPATITGELRRARGMAKRKNALSLRNHGRLPRPAS